MSAPSVQLQHIRLAEEDVGGKEIDSPSDDHDHLEDLSLHATPAGGRLAAFKQNRGAPLSDTQKRWVSSVGFYSDAYDLFVINMVLVILTSLYGLTAGDQAFITSMALAGAVTGQIVFGFLGDYLGRTTAWITTISFIIVSAIGSGLCFGSSAADVVDCIGIWRLILGFGIGGEYPLSATISAEASEHDVRGRNVARVFSAQGWGQITAPILIVILLSIFPENERSLQWTWRIALMFGAVPCILTFKYRWNLFRHEQSTQNNQPMKIEFRKSLTIIQENWRTLLGTAGAWFILDVTFYANGLFAATLLSLLGMDSNLTVFQKLKLIAEESVLMSIMAIPGYYAAIYFIDRIGRRRLQQIGFALMALLFFILGFAYNFMSARRLPFVLFYGLTFFFSNLGPNTTTFVVPSEVFRPEIRATCHGISAASGKLGAVVGNALMAFILHSGPDGPALTLIFSGVVSVLGLLLSLTSFVPETMGMHLDVISVPR